MFLFRRKPRGPEIWDYPDRESLNRSGAAFVREMARLRTRKGEPFTICISPAREVLDLCELLPYGPQHAAMQWDLVHLFWAWDKRAVEGAGESLFHTSQTRLRERLPIPDTNLHPIPVNKGEESAVALYEQEMERFFRTSVSPHTLPPWDMLLLDVGAGGKLGALDTGDPALDKPSRWASPLQDGSVGLTLRAMEGAENALLIATGASLREMVDLARAPDERFRTLPAGAIAPRGRRVWLTDQM